jgi:hypothetical protein
MRLTFASTGETITDSSSTIISTYQSQGVILDASGSVWRGDANESHIFLYSPVTTDPIPPSTSESAASWCLGIISSLPPLQANLAGHAKSLAASLDAIKPISIKTTARNKGLLDNLPADMALAEKVRLWDGTTLASHIPSSISIWVWRLHLI